MMEWSRQPNDKPADVPEEDVPFDRTGHVVFDSSCERAWGACPFLQVLMCGIMGNGEDVDKYRLCELDLPRITRRVPSPTCDDATLNP